MPARISAYNRNDKSFRMNIRRYSEERIEMNIYEYEYISLKIFEFIWMSEYSLHTGYCSINLTPAEKNSTICQVVLWLANLDVCGKLFIFLLIAIMMSLCRSKNEARFWIKHTGNNSSTSINTVYITVQMHLIFTCVPTLEVWILSIILLPGHILFSQKGLS